MLSEFSIVIAVGTHVSFLKSALTPWNEFCLILEICLVLNFSYLFIAFNSATLELVQDTGYNFIFPSFNFLP